MSDKKKHRKNGEGTLFKRKDGLWQASFVPENGKRLYFYGKTQAEALEKLRKAQQEEQKGILATGPKQRLGDYLIQWLEATHKPPMARHTTYTQYRSMIHKHLAPNLGNVFLHKLTVQQLQAFYARKLQEGLKPNSISVIHAVLHKALENAVKWNLISRNVASLVTVPRKNPHEVHALSTDEARKLIQAARDSRIEALLIIAITTGVRRGELLGLRWDDVDLERGVLHIRRTMSRVAGFGFIENDPKTKASRRRVTLPNVALEALKSHRIKQDQVKLEAGTSWIEKGLVFTNMTGNFLDPGHLLTLFYRVLDQAGLARMRFHDLRHSAATILLTMGVHPKVVQELLGHSTIAMTMDTYSHVLPSMQKDAMDGMDNLFR
jgi:integrase